MQNELDDDTQFDEWDRFMEIYGRAPTPDLGFSRYKRQRLRRKRRQEAEEKRRRKRPVSR